MKFATGDTECVYNGLDTPRTRRLLPADLHEKAAQIMDRLLAAHDLRDLSAPGLRLEKLSGKRAGQYSVRINEQYRVCFRWVNAEAVDVEITDYH
ncbi:MAG TPA: type II toxin-antitoxin system RelE/ParE family toxin [Candidatus Baltobacteraceae bacterium]|jgi:proteic killer suppression protein|nr:type II toxin-antitoxin system RelE/ParE family toxin [Candidatus Baltobacteraceae bacterium]